MVTKEYARYVLGEARKTLREPPPEYVARDAPLHYTTYPGPPEPEPEPEYVPGLDTTPAPPVDFWAEVDARIEARVVAERELWTEKVLGESLEQFAETISKALDGLQDASDAARRKDLDDFRAHIVRLDGVCNRLNDTMHAERSSKPGEARSLNKDASILDLPAWPHRTVRDVN
jgi:hypothetical protein